MNTEYQRVLPRDLFNEAKLLKCLGRLVLLIHDRKIPFIGEVIHDGEPFIIALNDEGSLIVTNVTIKVNKSAFTFKTTYNAKSNYPFYLETNDYSEVLVFDESGEFTEEFIEFVKTIDYATKK